MTYQGLLCLATGDVTFTDETGCQYTLTRDERKLLIEALNIANNIKNADADKITRDFLKKYYQCEKCKYHTNIDNCCKPYINCEIFGQSFMAIRKALLCIKDENSYKTRCGQKPDWRDLE